MGFTQSFEAMAVCRALLGVFEAGFLPGILEYSIYLPPSNASQDAHFLFLAGINATRLVNGKCSDHFNSFKLIDCTVWPRSGSFPFLWELFPPCLHMFSPSWKGNTVWMGGNVSQSPQSYIQTKSNRDFYHWRSPHSRALHFWMVSHRRFPCKSEISQHGRTTVCHWTYQWWSRRRRGRQGHIRGYFAPLEGSETLRLVLYIDGIYSAWLRIFLLSPNHSERESWILSLNVPAHECSTLCLGRYPCLHFILDCWSLSYPRTCHRISSSHDFHWHAHYRVRWEHFCQTLWRILGYWVSSILISLPVHKLWSKS